MSVIPRRLVGAPQGRAMTLRQTEFMDKTADRVADELVGLEEQLTRALTRVRALRGSKAA